jgi:hypothetical protein
MTSPIRPLVRLSEAAAAHLTLAVLLAAASAINSCLLLSYL